MKKKKVKYSQIKTFLFPQIGENKKEYNDKVINDWLKKNKILVESVMWDVQDGFIMVTIQYSKS